MHTRWTCFAMAALLALGAAACGKPETQPEGAFTVDDARSPMSNTPAPIRRVPETPEPDAAAPGDEAEAPGEDAEPAETPGAGEISLEALQAALTGTEWLVGDVHAAFGAERVELTGGIVNQISQSGIEARYTLQLDETAGHALLEAEVMGDTVTGTWDGERLVVGGIEGQLQ